MIPVGEGRELQHLIRVPHQADGSFEREELGNVRFMPLVGAQGWPPEEAWDGRAARAVSRPESIARLVREQAVQLEGIEKQDLGALLERIGDARLVLIGEASHGTSEFYRMRAEIMKALLKSRGFSFVAVEADWPDAAALNRWVHGRPPVPDDTGRMRPFQRFPTWMWRNHKTLGFLDWLRDHNANTRASHPPVAFYGLDLYNMFASIQAVLTFLDRVDPAAARIARERYACLTPWESDPGAYGRAALSGRYRVCEKEAVAMLSDLLARRPDYAQRDGETVLDAVENARLVADAERYYRAMYYGANDSWNLRCCVSQHSGPRPSHLQRPRTGLQDACAAGRGSIFLHPSLASRLAGACKLLGDVIADAEEDLVGSLSLECRMRHHFIVRFDVELNERT